MSEHGTRVVIDTGMAEDFKANLRGPVLGPDHPGYDRVAPVYNAMIHNRPQLIARCTDTADVMTAVDRARRLGIEVAVRGGGHNGAGLGTCDGLVIDLSLMRGVRIDPAARLAYVAGGATLADLDHAAHGFGLATPAGIIGTTGVGGLSLGGGLGHLTRKHGLTIDNLVAADVVLADGSFVTADERREPDLFWALRGGGGNFGVVTHLPAAPGPHRGGRSDAVAARAHRGDPALVPRVSPRGTAGAQRLLCLPHRAAGAAVPRGGNGHGVFSAKADREAAASTRQRMC